MKKKKYRVVYKYSDIHPPKKKSSYHNYYKAYYIKHKREVRIKQNIYYKLYYAKNKVTILLKSREKLIIKRQREKLHADMERYQRMHFLKKKYFRKWFLLTFKTTIKERNKKVRKYNKWLKELLTLHFD